jgi:hypothetical protein
MLAGQINTGAFYLFEAQKRKRKEVIDAHRKKFRKK